MVALSSLQSCLLGRPWTYIVVLPPGVSCSSYMDTGSIFILCLAVTVSITNPVLLRCCRTASCWQSHSLCGGHAWLTACSPLLEQPVRAESTDGPDCPCLASSGPFLQPAQYPGPCQPPGLSVLPQHHHTGAACSWDPLCQP